MRSILIAIFTLVAGIGGASQSWGQQSPIREHVSTYVEMNTLPGKAGSSDKITLVMPSEDTWLCHPQNPILVDKCHIFRSRLTGTGFYPVIMITAQLYSETLKQFEPVSNIDYCQNGQACYQIVNNPLLPPDPESEPPTPETQQPEPEQEDEELECVATDWRPPRHTVELGEQFTQYRTSSDCDEDSRSTTGTRRCEATPWTPPASRYGPGETYSQTRTRGDCATESRQTTNPETLACNTTWSPPVSNYCTTAQVTQTREIPAGQQCVTNTRSVVGTKVCIVDPPKLPTLQYAWSDWTEFACGIGGFEPGGNPNCGPGSGRGNPSGPNAGDMCSRNQSGSNAVSPSGQVLRCIITGP